MNSHNYQKSQMQAQVQDVKQKDLCNRLIDANAKIENPKINSKSQTQVQDVEQKHLYYSLTNPNTKIAKPMINFGRGEISYRVKINDIKKEVAYNYKTNYISVKNEEGEEIEGFVPQLNCREDCELVKIAKRDIKKIINNIKKINSCY